MHVWAGGELKGGGVACLVVIGAGGGGKLATQGSRRFRQRDKEAEWHYSGGLGNKGAVVVRPVRYCSCALSDPFRAAVSVALCGGSQMVLSFQGPQRPGKPPSVAAGERFCSVGDVLVGWTKVGGVCSLSLLV